MAVKNTMATRVSSYHPFYTISANPVKRAVTSQQHTSIPQWLFQTLIILMFPKLILSSLFSANHLTHTDHKELWLPSHYLDVSLLMSTLLDPLPLFQSQSTALWSRSHRLSPPQDSFLVIHSLLSFIFRLPHWFLNLNRWTCSSNSHLKRIKFNLLLDLMSSCCHSKSFLPP